MGALRDPGSPVVELGHGRGVVVYRVLAWRDGDEPHAAVVSSTFVRDHDEWKLAFHQQSPRSGLGFVGSRPLPLPGSPSSAARTIPINQGLGRSSQLNLEIGLGSCGGMASCRSSASNAGATESARAPR